MSETNNPKNNDETKSAASVLLSSLAGRKHKARMGADLNESVATGPSSFARKQLEKMGWTEGTGLGKNRDGRSTHVRVTKREDGRALGASGSRIDPVVSGDQWWKSSVGNTLARLRQRRDQKKKKKDKKKDDKKDKKRKRRKTEYTDEELFAATGGARFGMRAQSRQTGKWNRAEDAITEAAEAAAIAGTEWNGMAAPRVILSSSTSSSSSSSSKPDAKEAAAAAATTTAEPPQKKRRIISSAEDDDDESAGAEPDGTGGGDSETKKKKKKKDKKEKKEKKKKDKKKKTKPN